MTRQRILLIVLLAWALVMIVPDVLRVVQPFGLVRLLRRQ
jgi:hypothetical protein